MLLLTAACCRNSTFVCTGQRLVHAPVVLWSTGTSGLASMKHFASFPSDIVATYFSSRVFSFYQIFYSSTRANPGFVWNQQKRQHVWHIRVIRVHVLEVHIYPMYILWYNYNITAKLLHVVGTLVEIQYTAVRMHVCVCTYQVHIISSILCNNSNSNISSSATAASWVCCCLACSIYIQQDR